jgi:hypothetical protein
MHSAARRLTVLLAGLGLAGPAPADPARAEPAPPHRRYETTTSGGTRKTVIELEPAGGEAAPGPPAAPVPPAPAGPPDGPFVAEACAGGPRVWAEVDYLQWWYRPGAVPPLVTAGSLLDPVPGALGQPGTRVRYGNGPGTAEGTGGARARVGGWAAGGPVGWEVGGFYTVPQEQRGAFAPTGGDVLARPFFDALLNTPSSLLFGAPDAFDGSVSTFTRTTFWGLEANGLAAMSPDGAHTAFAGYRFLRMTDELAVSGRYLLGPGGLAFVNGVSLLPGATGLVEDRVFTRNEFHGGQVGWKYHGGFGRVGVDVRAAVAVGVGSERVDLAGSTRTVDADGVVRTAPAGLLVQASNAGRYGQDRLTVVPEVGARVSVCLAPGVSVHAGYDFLYWASVARAGDQLDHVVDTRQLPSGGTFTGGPGFRPVSPLRDTAFWAHGFNFGVRFEY